MLCIVICVLFLQAELASSIDCDLPWVQVGEKCLWKSSILATRWENYQNCRKMNSTLASPKTREENENLKMFIAGETNDFWLSARRVAIRGIQFSWMDGTPLAYNDWTRGEPTNIVAWREVCQHVDANVGWGDEFCDTRQKQLCEKAFPGNCELPWVKVGAKCLWKSSSLSNRKENLQNCEKMNATLVSPKTREENEQVKRFIAAEGGPFWLSAQRVAIQSLEFNWIDGRQLAYNNWKSGEPKNVQPNIFVCVQVGSAVGWADQLCDNKNKQLCEKGNAGDTGKEDDKNLEDLKKKYEEQKQILEDLKKKCEEKEKQLEEAKKNLENERKKYEEQKQELEYLKKKCEGNCRELETAMRQTEQKLQQEIQRNLQMSQEIESLKETISKKTAKFNALLKICGDKM